MRAYRIFLALAAALCLLPASPVLAQGYIVTLIADTSGPFDSFIEPSVKAK